MERQGHSMRGRGRQDAAHAPAFVRLALTNALEDITVLMAARMQQEALSGGLLLRQEGFRDGIGIVGEYLGEHEYAVALEHLCYLVEEARLPISQETYMALAAAGDALGMHPVYWTSLRPGVAACVLEMHGTVPCC